MFKKKFFKNLFDEDSDGNVHRTKFIQSRIKLVEKYIPELAKGVVDYIDKAAKCRDCIDQIAEVLENYSKAENVTTGFKCQLNDLANVLLEVGTRKDLQVHAMETGVLEQLGEYEKLCNNVRTELKLSLIASDKETNWAKQLQRLKESQFPNSEQISLAETEYLKAKGESGRASENLEEQIENFERQKLNNFKEILISWSLSELHFHSKSLELFTEIYRISADIDSNSDVEVLRNKLRSTVDSPRSDSLHRSESVLQLLSLPFHRNNRFSDSSGIPRHSSIQSSSMSSLL